MFLLFYIVLNLQGMDVKVQQPTKQTTLEVVQLPAQPELKVAPINNPLILVKE